MIKGNVYVRINPATKVVNATKDRYSHDKESIVREADSAAAKTLFDLEMWLNGEIATQAFQKFGVGLRVHVPEGD